MRSPSAGSPRRARVSISGRCSGPPICRRCRCSTSLPAMHPRLYFSRGGDDEVDGSKTTILEFREDCEPDARGDRRRYRHAGPRARLGRARDRAHPAHRAALLGGRATGDDGLVPRRSPDRRPRSGADVGVVREDPGRRRARRPAIPSAPGRPTSKRSRPTPTSACSRSTPAKTSAKPRTDAPADPREVPLPDPAQMR